MTRVLLVSTYELGERPIALTLGAAALGAAGHEVRARDLAVEEWSDEDLLWADALACSVPMHTALRLGLTVLERARRAPSSRSRSSASTPRWRANSASSPNATSPSPTVPNEQLRMTFATAQRFSPSW